MRRYESKPVAGQPVVFQTSWYYAMGRRVGDITTDPDDTTRLSYAEELARAEQVKISPQDRFKMKPVTSADFDQNYEPINSTYPAAVSTTYVARTGDTLRSVARAVWGDDAMCYLIAEANGMSVDTALTQNQVLVIPNKVTNIHNNAQTFRPYNPGETIGRVDPTLPPVPQPPQQDSGCGVVGQIVMIAIAVAVTVYTAGAASTLLAGGSLGGVGATMSAGMTVLSGGAAFGASAGVAAAGSLMTASAAGLAGAAIGGAVGSIASQGFAMATGMQDSFSWRQVGISALGSAITAGIGQAANAGNLSSFLTNAKDPLVAAGRSALSAGATMAVQGKWNWSTVMASAIGAGVGSGVSAMPGVNSLVGSALGNVAGQLAGPGGKVNFSAVLGSALGSAVSAPEQTQGVGPYSSIDYEDEFDRQDSAAVQAGQRSQAIYGLGGGGARLGGGGTGPSWDSLVDSGISPTAVAMEAPDGFDGQFGGVTQGRSFVESQVLMEVLGQQAREESLSGWKLFQTGGPVRNIPRAGVGNFEMVRNGNWDAALNIGADPIGLLGELGGLQSDLARLNRSVTEGRIDDMRRAMIDAGVKNVPDRYVQSLVAGADGSGGIVRDYGATVNELQGVYENHVRDTRLRETWGENYQNLRLGKSQLTVLELEKRVLDVQQQATNKYYEKGVDLIAKGELPIKGDYMRTLGSYMDGQVRFELRGLTRSEGISESMISNIWGVNRGIRSDLVEGLGIPDNRLGSNLFADTTLARKSGYTDQIIKWNAIRPDGNYLIIRPTNMPGGGSYVIPRTAIQPYNPVRSSGRGM